MRTLAIVLLALAFVVPAYCAEVGTAEIPATQATERAIGVISEITVDKVDAAIGEVVVNSEKIAVNAATLIKIDGKAAKLADLKKDMMVTVECEVAVSKKTAKSIDAKGPIAIPAPVKK